MNIYQTGIKKFLPQIASTEVSNGKNNSAVRQVKRLIKVLYHTNHYYYIHVDIRQDYLYRELLALEKILPNVHLTRRRFATIWGGASLLEMLRSCMWELLNIKNWKWDFVLNLSESDYPVKTVTQLTQFLTANKNRNFVKSHGREVQRFIQKQGLDKTFVECETRMWRVGDRQLPYGIQVDGGSDWIALSRKLVEYVANPTPDDLVAGLLKIFKYTLLPAESFFHTVLRNSKFCNTYIDNNLHVTNWKRKLGCKCQYKHVVDWCGCSPNDFRPDDWPRVLSTQSRQLYFARKFEPIVNQAVILQLELWLFGLEEPSKNILNVHSYWQNVYHHQDLGVTPDDGLLTLGGSIKRQLVKYFRYSNSTLCDLDVSSVLQMHTFLSMDAYKHTLFLLRTSQVDIEVAVKPINNVNLTKTSPLMAHVELLFVSTDYDQKEQMSRNFLQLVSPFSEPILIYRFSSFHSSKTYNLTCLWISSSGYLQDVSEFSAGRHIVDWLCSLLYQVYGAPKLIYKNTILAEIKFLVTPLDFFFGKPLKAIHTLFANMDIITTKDVNGKFTKFIPDPLQRATLEQASQTDSKRVGDSLTTWIDELFSKFYSDTVDVCGKKIAACVKTGWSSLAPDPKSAIGTVNGTTGTFNIW
ncbi:hypothetical protein NQ317_016297 [Molorchus minor]|uniref:protein xylosyltransferase n=1 Tax=Molorchus minor TaxID=1323400 RepID=A0ABQ9ITV8_9CUCU|nr:hypothetical protein NQ317_016297 [Molorchus minor]